MQEGQKTVLITGGAGFVGTNLADRLLREGCRVRIFDNLSRKGVQHNADWLKAQHGDSVELIIGDVRDSEAVSAAASGVQAIFHFAAQVAVTTSLVDPITDFEVNARGTLNVLEAARAQERPPFVLCTSTNKVYGDLCDIAIAEIEGAYAPEEELLRRHGISERRPLDFHSPYGCSKGAADQYVLDYGRSYGMPTVVFRMSCIYGPHQFGNEDQGWVAHFLIKALNGDTITLYGDGKQVRDILFVEDLVEAMVRAWQASPVIAGEVFNIGGGVTNATSLIQLLDRIGSITGRPVERTFDEWRVGDQKYFVADTGKIERHLDWCAKVDIHEGVSRLAEWLSAESPLVKGGQFAFTPAAGA